MGEMNNQTKKTMETLKIKTQEELENYKASGEVAHLNIREWEGGYIDLEGAITGYIYLKNAITGDIDLENAETGHIYLNGAITGDIYLKNAITGYIYLKNAKTGGIDLRYAETGYIDLKNAKTGEILRNYTKEDVEFLKSLPIDKIKMENWHSDNGWLNCKSEEELHECGTAHCIRGWAEALYKIKHGKVVDNPNTLIPNLNHLFFMTDEQARKEIDHIIETYG